MSSKPSQDSQQIVNFSQHIHPRNPYQKYDFESIAKEFLEFKSYLNQAPSKDPQKPVKYFLNWSDRDAVRCLMKCCLKRDFGLDLEMPEGCLAPSLALKMNYLLWIEDMAKLNESTNVSGLDIGTGGGIYFCAMAAKRFGWKMVGSETNSIDFKIAERNVLKNNLTMSVKVFHNKDKSVIFPSDIFVNFDLSGTDRSSLTFSLCNPPFYEVTEQRREWKKFTEKNPGREHEMTIAGGEVDFIGKMIDQSTKYGDKIDLFTTLVGQKKSLGRLQEKLSQSKEVKKWILNEFCQGKTMRWCLAWTFKDTLKLKASAPISETRHEKKLHIPVQFSIEKLDSKSEFDLEDVDKWINGLIQSLSIEVMKKEKTDKEILIEFRSFQSNWRGQRAKKRQAKLRELQSQSEDTDKSEPDAKKARLECEEPENDSFPEPLVVGNLHVHFLIDGKMVLDMAYESGSMGKSAVVELSQFFKNRLNVNHSNEKCKNAR